MADGSVVMGGLDPLCTLLQADGDIRREAAQYSADERRDVAAAEGNVRRDVKETESQVRRDVVGTSGDARREVAVGVGEIRRDVAADTSLTIDSVNKAGWANSDRTGTEADRVVAQDTAYFIAAQSQNFSNATALAALKASTDASFAKTQADIALASAQAVAASSLAGEKNAAATALAAATSAAAAQLAAAQLGTANALASANTNQLIVADGSATRALMNALNADELNRKLIERNALIVEERSRAHCCHGQLSATLANAQQNQVLSAINALNSQIQDTKQSVNNFGTYLGTQTANPVNVR